MAQLLVSMNLSLDGYIEAQGQDDGSWLRIDEAVHRAFNELAASAEAFLYGRKVYEVMVPYWPGPGCRRHMSVCTQAPWSSKRATTTVRR